jgi:hypothetical protein
LRRKIEPAAPIGSAQPDAMTLGGGVNEAEGSEMMRFALMMAFVLMPVFNEAAAGKTMIRPDYIDYVCGISGGQSKTYFNFYLARFDGATLIRPGRCEDQQYRK